MKDRAKLIADLKAIQKVVAEEPLTHNDIKALAKLERAIDFLAAEPVAETRPKK